MVCAGLSCRLLYLVDAGDMPLLCSSEEVVRVLSFGVLPGGERDSVDMTEVEILRLSLVLELSGVVAGVAMTV